MNLKNRKVLMVTVGLMLLCVCIVCFASRSTLIFVGNSYENSQDILDEMPNIEMLKQFGEMKIANSANASSLDVAITANSNKYDCVSRYFAPASGINEDPVTGSIHTAIVPIWAEKLGKNQLLAYQASIRGGELFCEIKAHDRIEISGYAKLYMQAEIFI